MPRIELLSQDTIDKIAAGEVVERPSSVVKELVENAIDAKATAITIEIKEGGISFIRISDNGCGIEKSEVPLAFLRHSTSKIRSVEDLMCVASLGFRGEALSSIAAVSRVELITKTPDSLTGVRYQIEGSKEIALEEIGAPDGTTFLIKDLFYNTPARKKFLKSAQTEGAYIADMVEKLALSHPDISFKFIQNNQTKLHTSGNGNVKDLIYHVFGREISASLLPVNIENELFSLTGYIGKPVITRGNRNYEIYFINGRYIKSNLLSKAIEEAYKSFLMQHQYPFCVLYFAFKGESLDVNVHPTKMELRFDNNTEVYQLLCDGLYEVLSQKEMIPGVPVTEEKKAAAIVREYKESIPEPFEKRRLNEIREAVSKDSPYEVKYPERFHRNVNSNTTQISEPMNSYGSNAKMDRYENITLESLSSEFLTQDAKKNHRIIGQLFKTYWLVEFEDKLFIIDQHAAHEKVLYERTMANLKEKEFTSQAISPPIILSLDSNEILMLEKYREQIEQMGYVVESFGGKEYMISGIPDNLFRMDMKELFIEMLDDFSNMSGKETPELILEKVASMSCKAAVKGNQTLSYSEFDTLVTELLTLENPYNCPHGRPTIISMTKYEIEKKFKRII
ncbi:MAG: DNA mismatch repair endonuclease MutL [Agathobacter sp.]|nr:DNA mismatch repair endonuclease MutL [Agathobacter sp.]